MRAPLLHTDACAFGFLQRQRALFAAHFDWAAWEAVVRRHGLTVDRPRDTAHPDYPEIVYPMDYGYVNATAATDAQELDAFIGTGSGGLVGLLLTADYRKGDCEAKLLVDCTPREVYLANGFINHDRTLLEGVLVLRRPLHGS